MKILILIATLFLSLQSPASEKRSFKMTGVNEATVKIITADKESTQVAAYVDGAENNKFMAALSKNPKSLLAQHIREIEIENCDADAVADKEGWIPTCGRVHLTAGVMTAYARGGWMSAGGKYTFFIGFLNAGTGHFFQATHMITISETGEADVDDRGEYLGSITKTLALEEITPLPRSKE